MRLAATILLITQLLARSLAVQHGHAPNECRSHGVDHDVRTHMHIGIWGGHSADDEHTTAAGHGHSHGDSREHSHDRTQQPEQDSFVIYLGSAVLVAPAPRVAAPALDVSWCWLAQVDTPCGIRPDPPTRECVSLLPADGGDGRFRFLAHVLRI